MTTASDEQNAYTVNSALPERMRALMPRVAVGPQMDDKFTRRFAPVPVTPSVDPEITDYVHSNRPGVRWLAYNLRDTNTRNEELPGRAALSSDGQMHDVPAVPMPTWFDAQRSNTRRNLPYPPVPVE